MEVTNALIPRWAVAWILISNLATTPDFLFVFFQPHSLKGGKYGHLFPFTLWQIYAEWGGRYANPEDHFNRAQSILNVVELFMGVGALWKFGTKSQKGAKLILVVSIMTFYKTCIYFLIEIVSGLEYFLSHNSVWIQLLVAVLSLPWIICPAILSLTILDRLYMRKRKVSFKEDSLKEEIFKEDSFKEN